VSGEQAKTEKASDKSTEENDAVQYRFEDLQNAVFFARGGPLGVRNQKPPMKPS
jgi:hypothetical protein